MSVLINGMDIPKNCYDCKLNKSCDARWFLEIDRRPDDCPLVDVPKESEGIISKTLQIIAMKKLMAEIESGE